MLRSIVQLVDRRTRHARAIRGVAVSAYAQLARANVFLGGDRILLNGPPKSGTHLASECLRAMPKTAYSGRHFSLADFTVSRDRRYESAFAERFPELDLDIPRLERFLRHTPRGMFATAHARYEKHVAQTFAELGLRHILLLRDPRDIAVSDVHYVSSSPWHEHHEAMNALRGGFEAQLLGTIVGQDFSATDQVPSIGEIVRGYLPWMCSNSVLVVRFEDLVGETGGGSRERQINAITQIAEFIGRPLTPPDASGIAERTWNAKSQTFRRGAIGGWRAAFNDDHRSAFKEVAGDLLVTLGYESNLNW